jgi:hypothetical protein
MRDVVALAILAAQAGACASRENPSIRPFHATVRPGATLLDVVRDAERTQAADASFSVVSQDCPGPFLSVGRVPGLLHIRVTQPVTVSNPSSEPGYTETGYASREEFQHALEGQLPLFYGCKTYRLEFGRDQIWPVSDVFTVTIDTSGHVTSVSKLSEQ